MKTLAILIPVYRNQSGLERTLRSLRSARGEFSVVIVDDGTPEPIVIHEHLHENIAVTLLRLKENVGIAAALNHGLRHILASSPKYIARLDAGDTVSEDRFERQVSFLESNQRCGAVASFVDFVNDQQSTLFQYRAPTDHADITRRMFLNNCMIHPATTIRIGALRDVGIYRENVIGAEDYDLFLRMAQKHTLAIIPEVLTRCEYTPDGLSVAGRRRQQKTRLRLQLLYFDPFSLYSSLGIARTLGMMLTPHSLVFRLKLLLQARGHGRLRGIFHTTT